MSAECNANDARGCTETFVYRPGTRARVWVPLELLYTAAKNNLTQRYWYETDAHGSVVALMDASSQVVDRYTILASDVAGSIEIVVAPRRDGATIAGCAQGSFCPCGGRIAAAVLDCSEDCSTASCEEGICRA